MPLEEPSDGPGHVNEAETSVTFCLDSALRITYCNLAWDQFALLNDGSHLARPAVIGRCILDFISGPDHDYYAEAYKRVLTTNESWEHEYECSSTQIYRKFRLRVFPMQKISGLLVVNSLLTESAQLARSEQPLEHLYRTQEGLLIMCSSCRRTRRNNPGIPIWDWVPGFLEPMAERVSHAICAPCKELYYPSEE